MLTLDTLKRIADNDPRWMFSAYEPLDTLVKMGYLTGEIDDVYSWIASKQSVGLSAKLIFTGENYHNLPETVVMYAYAEYPEDVGLIQTEALEIVAEDRYKNKAIKTAQIPAELVQMFTDLPDDVNYVDILVRYTPSSKLATMTIKAVS